MNDPGTAATETPAARRVEPMIEPRIEEFGPAALRLDRVRHNAAQIARFAGIDHGADLRGAFLTALNRLQRYQFGFERAGIQLEFDARGAVLETLQYLMIVDTMPERWRFTPPEQDVITTQIRGGLSLLSRMAPRTREAMDLLVGQLVMGRLPHYGGGSRSAVIGPIWLSPYPTWNTILYAECLVHEYTHQALFLEAMVHTIFSRTQDEMDSTGLVRSTLLGIERGYDKAYHSAFVSYVILQFYARLGLSSTHYRHLVAPLRVTLDGLEAASEYLTAHGQQVLAQLREDFEQSTFARLG